MCGAGGLKSYPNYVSSIQDGLWEFHTISRLTKFQLYKVSSVNNVAPVSYSLSKS